MTKSCLLSLAHRATILARTIHLRTAFKKAIKIPLQLLECVHVHCIALASTTFAHGTFLLKFLDSFFRRAKRVFALSPVGVGLAHILLGEILQ